MLTISTLHVKLLGLVAALCLFCSASTLRAQLQLGPDIDGEAAGDYSGRSVSLSADGQRLAVGAPYNVGSGGYAGHVRVYTFDSTTWQQLGADIDGEAVADLSGSTVSLSADGQRLAVGVNRNDGNGSDAGHVRVYTFDGTEWEQLGADIDGEAAGDQSGQPVSLSADGQRLAVGARFNDGNGTDAGHVRVFSLPPGTLPVREGYSGSADASLGLGCLPKPRTRPFKHRWPACCQPRRQDSD